MRVDLHQALVPDDMRPWPCGLCSTLFELKSVTVNIEPEGLAICEACLRCLNRRQEEGDVKVYWPSWTEYQDALKAYPTPLFASNEELELAAAAKGPHRSWDLDIPRD